MNSFLTFEFANNAFPRIEQKKDYKPVGDLAREC